MKIRPQTVRRVLKPGWFILLVLPLGWLLFQWGILLNGGDHAMTVNPIEFTNRALGDWALRILIITLTLSPLGRLTGSGIPVQLRRMTGLFAFAYIVLHISSYVVLDQFFDWTVIWADIVKRKFITVGMLSLLLITPLAVTSTKKMIRRLGAGNWRRLHRLIYIIAPLAALHYTFMVKGDQLEPKIYMAIIFILLALRIPPISALLSRRRRTLPA